jgi:hypothetical protein
LLLNVVFLWRKIDLKFFSLGIYMTDFVEEVDLPREECIKVVADKVLFEADDLYKSVETFKQQIPNLPEYVYWILFLRYNKNIISEEETRFAEETISQLRKSMKEEQSYYQKLFEDNKENLIDCSPLLEKVKPLDNELTNIGFN